MVISSVFEKFVIKLFTERKIIAIVFPSPSPVDFII